jgi:hypothetical protein
MFKWCASPRRRLFSELGGAFGNLDRSIRNVSSGLVALVVRKDSADRQ